MAKRRPTDQARQPRVSGNYPREEQCGLLGGTSVQCCPAREMSSRTQESNAPAVWPYEVGITRRFGECT